MSDGDGNDQPVIKIFGNIYVFRTTALIHPPPLQLDFSARIKFSDFTKYLEKIHNAKSTAEKEDKLKRFIGSISEFRKKFIAEEGPDVVYSIDLVDLRSVIVYSALFNRKQVSTRFCASSCPKKTRNVRHMASGGNDWAICW